MAGEDAVEDGPDDADAQDVAQVAGVVNIDNGFDAAVYAHRINSSVA